MSHSPHFGDYETAVDEDIDEIRELLDEDADPEEQFQAVLDFTAERLKDADFAFVTSGTATDTGGMMEAGEFRTMVVVNPLKEISPEAQADGLLRSALAVAVMNWGFWRTLKNAFTVWRRT